MNRPSGTPQFIGRPAIPLPHAVVAAIAIACARDERVDAAHLFMSLLPMPGEEPHHTVGLNGETLDFQVRTRSHRSFPDAAGPPIFERNAAG